MENEDVIRQQMEETRTALSDKLETLESEVADTVRGATAAVTETVETVTDTVQEAAATVKDSVQETIGAVKETVQEGAATVRDWFDLKAHVEHHPWLMVGGAGLLGYWLERVLDGGAALARENGASMPGQRPPYSPSPYSPSPYLANGNGRDGRSAETAPRPSVRTTFGPEIQKLKTLALTYLANNAREMIVRTAPENMKGQVGEAFDDFAAKVIEEMVGKPEACGSGEPGSDFCG